MLKTDDIPNNQEQILQEADNNSNKDQISSSALETDYKDLFMRCTADLQNFRRRVEKERAEWMQIAQAEAISKFLSIADDLERALEHMPETTTQNDEFAQTIEGFSLIFKNFKKVLTDLGVTEVQASGPFNPEMHEAVMEAESIAHPSGHIVQTLSKGYLLNGKVIRYAKVSVAK